MSERMTDEEATAADKAITAAGWVSNKGVGAKIRADWLRARTSETEKDAEIAKKDTVIKALADYIANRAGHEEHCRGWRRPVKDKSAPTWKRRGEWIEISACTCGPGKLLRLAGRIP